MVLYHFVPLCVLLPYPHSNAVCTCAVTIFHLGLLFVATLKMVEFCWRFYELHTHSMDLKITILFINIVRCNIYVQLLCTRV